MATILKSWFTNFDKVFLRPKIKGDGTLLIIILGLLAFGLLMVYSSSFLYAEERTGDGLFFLRKQIIYAAIGLFGAWTMTWVPIKKYLDHALLIFTVSITLLVLVMIPGLGSKVGGAQRWISLGLFRFQPAELAKFASILFCARQLVKIPKTAPEIKRFLIGPLGLILPVLVLLMLQPDFGSTAIIVLTLGLLLVIGGIRWSWILGSALSAFTAGAALILTSTYRKARLMSFLDPWTDASGKGFQVIQSMLGLHNGSLFGAGLGNGKEKLFFLPEAHNDFIFAVIGEELGFAGVVAVVLVYILLIYRGLKISWTALERKDNRFSFFLGCGVTILLGLQSFINMGVVLGLLPTKGLTLPFISYGGTALIVNLLEIGILYRISVENEK